MPQQYPSFSAQGPQIDINLYPDAVSAGINQGNAQKTPLQAITQGLTSGIQTGVKVATGLAQLEAQQNENAITGDPAVQEAKKQEIIARSETAQTEAYKAQLEQEVLQNNEEEAKATELAILLRKKAESKAAADIAENTSKDLITRDGFSNTIATGNVQAIQEALTSPQMLGAMQRNTEYALQAIAGARAAGVPANVVDPLYNQFDAVAQEKRRAQIYQDNLKASAARKQKQQEETDKARLLIEGIPEVSILKEKLGDSYDERNLVVYPASVADKNGRIKFDPVTKKIIPAGFKTDANKDSYILTYKDSVLSSNITPSQKAEYEKATNLLRIDTQLKNTLLKEEQGDNVLKNKASPGSSPSGLAARTYEESNLNDTSNQNQAIIEKARRRNQTYKDEALARGTADTYSEMENRGKFSKKSAPVNYYQTPQTVPVLTGQSLTRPVRSDAEEYDGTISIQDHLNKLFGEEVTLELQGPIVNVDDKLYKKILAIPGMQNMSAVIKGMAVTESRGNPDAVSNAGAVGLMQLTEAAAKDVGLPPSYRTDPELSIKASADYISLKVASITTALRKQLKETGLPIEPDIRMVLAAYNGGDKDIKRAIAAGYTSWDGVAYFIENNSGKSAKNIKENIEYANKVISAAIPFMNGGNASDDAFAMQLINTNLINLRSRQ